MYGKTLPPRDQAAGTPLGTVSRFPPARDVPVDDGSILQTLYHTIPHPNTEWWWLAISIQASDEEGQAEHFSLIVNVQITGAKGGPEPCASAVIALRNERRRTATVLCQEGALAAGPTCTFTASGWYLGRAEPTSEGYQQQAMALGCPEEISERAICGVYGISVRSDQLSLAIILEGLSCAVPGQRGWIDHDPDGPVPLWASLKTRRYAPTGSIHWRGRNFQISEGDAHFEQQCLLSTASVPTLVGKMLSPLKHLSSNHFVLGLKLKWHWFRIGFDDSSLSAFVLWNKESGRVLRTFCAITNAQGNAEEVSDFEVTPEAYYERSGLLVPLFVQLRFLDPSTRAPCELRLTHEADMDWMVPYRTPYGITCWAHEAECHVEILRTDRVLGIRSANQETIDLPLSLSPWKSSHE